MDTTLLIIALAVAAAAIVVAAIIATVFFLKYKSSGKEAELIAEKAKTETAQQVAAVQQECVRLKERIASLEQEAVRADSENHALLLSKDLEIAKAENEGRVKATRLETEFASFKSAAVREQELAVEKATSEAKQQLAEAERKYAEFESETQKEKESLKFTIEEREREIERIRNDKAKLSVKLLGESLEQHCEVAFTQVRNYAFPNAEFGKDNDASHGSKGDYIFREKDEGGAELLSIMFEMKNEAEGSVHTKKNSDYFGKLDKDRREKGCEYAVLVSLLEPDNELYNVGIADMSHEYPKMFVIRPQFFVPFIGLLRCAALSSLEAKRDLERMRQEDVDLTTFEDKLEGLKGTAVSYYDKTHSKCESAAKGIKLAINKMESVQRDIESIDSNSNKAREKTEDLTIRKLTWKNKGMQEALANAKPAVSDDSQ